MATFTGTDASELFSQGDLSGTVIVDPPGSLPGDGGDTYAPGGGDDTVFGGLGGDMIDERDATADGADLFLGGGGSDTLYGGADEDVLQGEGDDDYLYGGEAADLLEGGDGDDYLDGGTGRDRMFGGAGDDTFFFDLSARAGDTLTGRTLANGGSGRDRLQLSAPFDADIRVVVDLRKGLVTTLDEKWKLVSIENVEGSDGARIYGSDKHNEIYSSGSSKVWALGGDDRVESYYGTPEIDLGDGDDTGLGGGEEDEFHGGRGDDLILGRGGDDQIFGEAGNDRLYGDHEGDSGNGEDLLVGGAGNDILQGGFYSDTLYGGAGRDRFVFDSAFASKYDRLDEIRGGAPEGFSRSGSVDEAFEGPGSARGDRIDLRGIDAFQGPEGEDFENNAFTFRSTEQGGLWLRDRGDVTMVYGNVDTDANAEFVLAIYDGDVKASEYTRADFLL